MNTFQAFQKGLYVFVLLIMMFMIDYFKIEDAALKWTIIGLIGMITGWSGYQSLPGFPGSGKTGS